MKTLVCMLLLASQGSVELLDESPTIAAGKWNYYRVALRQQTARVIAHYEVTSPSGTAQLALLTHDDADRLFRDMPYGVLATSGVSRSGGLSFRVPSTGDYDLVLDNRHGSQDVSVRVRVWLDFNADAPVVRTASPQRRLVVTGLSLAFFLGVVTYSTRRILRAIAR
jgi:hypothetical protein